MKKFVLFIFVLVVVFLLVQLAYVFVVKVIDQDKIEFFVEVVGFEMNGLENFIIDEFLDLIFKKICQEIGEKLNFKEIIVFKVVQKVVKKELCKGNEDKLKSQLVVLLLVILVGIIGIYCFYFGYIMIGIIQLLILGGCGIWILIDFICIVMGDFGLVDGSVYDLMF